MSDAPKDSHDPDSSKAPLIEHLIELRQRLFWSILALIACFIVCYLFVDEIFAILVHPLVEAFPEGKGRLIYTKLYEAFFVEVKLALFASFFLSFPVIATQLWKFVAPGLYANEKKAFLPFLVATPVLFLLGASLAYFLVMPLAFEWMLSFSGEAGGLSLEALPGTDEYLSLVMQFILAFGIAFQLPILVLLVHRAGLVSYEKLASIRRYMIVVSFGAAAILTPPDVISQLMLGIPLILLYEISLLIIRVGKMRAKKEATETAAP